MSTALVRSGVDALTSSLSPSANASTWRTLRLQGAGGATKYGFIYLKSPVPRGGTVLSATLRLFGLGNWGASETVSLRRIAAKWSATRLTYSNQPGVTGATVSVTQTETVDATEWAFDVTSLIQLIADGAANYGFRLSTTSSTERRFYSLDALDHRPVLEVEWSDAPDAPTDLSPAGGALVTLAKPTVTFTFHDVSGATAMAACQVQINPTNSFTSPAFDSGAVATSDPELDLSATAYAGLSSGDTVYWRVRVQDAAGLWSDWSHSTSFTRTTRGSLAINSPTGGVVEDVTPDIIWTLTGATQTAWRVTVWDDADPTETLYDSGRRSGTGNSLTLPKGVITSESTTYRLRVRVWESLGRVKTPGDPAFTEAVTTFVYNDDPTPDPVTSLTAVQVGSGKPYMQLTWHRATAPDFYSIWRNGKLIDTDLDPADLIISGTTYGFVDRTCTPHDAMTYKVRPKVNGTLGSSPTVTASFDVAEVWLAHIDSGRITPVLPASGDQMSFDMPETATVYRPVNGVAVSRVVAGQSGLEGTIAGRIIDWAGSAASSYVANLLWMKKRPSETYRLTLGAQNLPVNIGNVVVAPLVGGKPGDRQVSFDFWSLDGVTQQ